MSLQSIVYSVVPSFDAGSSYVLRLDEDGESYNFTDIRPSMQHLTAEEEAQLCRHYQVPVETTAVQELWETVRQLALCPLPPFNTGCDGTTHYLTMTCGFNEVHFVWWPELPEEWRALATITETLTRWAGNEGGEGGEGGEENNGQPQTQTIL